VSDIEAWSNASQGALGVRMGWLCGNIDFLNAYHCQSSTDPVMG